MRSDMEKRILRVTDHIFDNPAGDLSLNTLASVAAMSPYHWHRVFHAMTGEPLAQAVRRIRLQRASQMLVHQDHSVATVARAVGYPNAASFSRAFAARFGMSPLAFRAQGLAGPGNPRAHDRNFPRIALQWPCEIRDLPALHLAAIEHRGDYNRIDRAFETLLNTFAAREIMGEIRGVFGVFPDDPASTPFSELRSHAGFAVGEHVALSAPLVRVRLPGDRHVVMTVRGPFSGLADAFDQLFNAWLPDSGEEPGDSPTYIAYLTDAATTAPADLLCEIRVPLRSR